MKLGIIGSREFKDYDKVVSIITTMFNVSEIDTIVSGGANGADTLGERFADEYNIKTCIHLPKWGLYGKKAGFIRNTDIIKDSDFVIAFWDGLSKGTKSSIDLCISNRVNYIVIFIDRADDNDIMDFLED